jgi:gas vesicle protein
VVSLNKGADTMKRSTKVKIGVGVIVAASTATAVVASGKLIEKARHVSNRCKVKRFVNAKFDGSETLLAIVDKLSDEDLDNIMSILDKIKSGKKRVSVYGDSIKDTTEDLKDRLMDLVDKVM